MTKKTLTAEPRSITGRKVKNLRAKGILPANVYGKKVNSISLQVGLKDFLDLYSQVGETGLVELSIGKEVRPVLIHNLQKNPKSDQVIHVDFLQVDLKEKVTAEVPVELVGESPAEKQALGTVVQQLNQVEVEALPTDLPEKFEVNTEVLSEVDQAIFVKDLKVDTSKVEIKTDPEAIVAKVEPPQKEEVAPAPTDEAAESVEGTATEVPSESQSEESQNAEQK